MNFNLYSKHHLIAIDSFYYSLLLLNWYIMTNELNQKCERIMLEIQTILQKILQTVDVVSGYW